MMPDLLLYALIVIIFSYAFFKWATVNNDYFAKRKLLHLKPNFLFGNTSGMFLKKYTPFEFSNKIYNQFPTAKLIGIFDMRTPTYFVRDVELIKQIAIKDFDYMEDHTAFIEDKSDALFGNSLFMLKGKKWRDMRATLSPAFTGSKMRHMFELVTECAEDMSKYFVNEAKDNRPIRWEMKELCSRYTSDVIASCAFGIKVDSLKDRKNEFYTIGKESFDFQSLKVGLRMMVIRTLPTLMRALDIEFFPAITKKFFKSMVLDAMQVRKEKQIVRPDMINILMQVRSGILKHHHDEVHTKDAGFATVEESNIGKERVKNDWSDDEIVAQCFIFFAAGFDSVATTLSFLSYELAIDQDVQQKLYEEIRETNQTLNGARLTYDSLQKMKYLDQVLSEGLRKWPPAIFTTRLCTKDYMCELEDNEKVLIEKGSPLWIPITSIHRDEKFWPEPEKFDPERFSEENKHNIVQSAYIPFGVGPRNCIGSRFALMEMKAILFYLLRDFSIQPYEDTQIPLRIAKSAANWVTEKGIHLEFKARA